MKSVRLLGLRVLVLRLLGLRSAGLNKSHDRPRSFGLYAGQGVQGVKLLLLCLSLTGCEYIDDLPASSRFISKNICSGLFVAGYEEDRLVDRFITPIVPPLKSLWNVAIDPAGKTVTVTDKIFKNTFKSTALYREPIGCVNQLDFEPEQLRAEAPMTIEAPVLPATEPWPSGAAGISPLAADIIDLAALEAIIDAEFVEPEPATKNSGGKNTVAVAIAYQGQLVAERYSDGLTPYSPLKGYSMSKSLVNSVAGILSDRGLLTVDQPTGFQEWQQDDRAQITLEHLMHMESGLAYVERAMGSQSDQSQLLYGSKSPVEFAMALRVEAPPATRFNYSSADNILAAKLLQDTLGGVQPMYEFYQRELFHRINVTTAVVENGVDNYLLAPESLMLSARDWARLGQLYANGGSWNGATILSQSWLDFTVKEAATNESYGAFIWLNHGGYWFPDLPEDTLAFVGAFERFVIAIPSLDLVVVRIGFTHDRDTVDMNAFVSQIVAILN